MKLIPNHAEHKMLLAKAYELLENRVGQSQIIAETHISQSMLSGYKPKKKPGAVSKNISDETIATFDRLYSGWRSFDVVEDLFKQEDENAKVAIKTKIDAFLETILFCYQGLSPKSKDILALTANNLYQSDNPNAQNIATPSIKGESSKAIKKEVLEPGEEKSLDKNDDQARKMVEQARKSMRSIRKNNVSGKPITKDNKIR